MEILKQFMIILVVACLGELLAWLIPLPIPGSVYGLILMFTALCLKIIKLKHVEKASSFLLETLIVMFTPPAVGLIAMWDVLKNVWIEVLVIVVLTTFFIMFVTGHVAQFIIRRSKNKETTKISDETELENGESKVASSECGAV